MYVSKGCFDLYAVKFFTNQNISWSFEKPSRLSDRHFKSLFLLSVDEVTILWEFLDDNYKKTMPFTRPEHLLFALYYLKVYPTWDQMATTTGRTEKTLRKWVGIVVEFLLEIDNWVSSTPVLASTLILFTCNVPISQLAHCFHHSCRSLGRIV